MKSSTVTKLIVLFVYMFSASDAFAQCSITSNLVTNGDFESGNTGFSSSYGYNPGNLTPEGKYDVLSNPRDDHSNFSACSDHTTGAGNQMMVVNGASVAGVTVWCSSVNVSQNSSYTFSTWVASVHPTSPAILQFSINGVNLGSPFTASSTTCNWQQFCETWSSGSSTTANICIVNQNTAAAGNDFALDDIQMGITATLFVNVVNFSAKSYEQGTHLKWTSNTEIDHDYFAVEKSNDLANWQEIDKLYSKGSLGNITDYEYFDFHNNENKVLYYRLRNVDKFGKVEYSTIKSSVSTKSEINICPNPTYDKIYVFGAHNIQQVIICNSLEVEQKRFEFNEVPNPLEIDLSNLQPGIYYLKIISEKEGILMQDIVRCVKR